MPGCCPARRDFDERWRAESIAGQVGPEEQHVRRPQPFVESGVTFVDPNMPGEQVANRTPAETRLGCVLRNHSEQVSPGEGYSIWL